MARRVAARPEAAPKLRLLFCGGPLFTHHPGPTGPAALMAYLTILGAIQRASAVSRLAAGSIWWVQVISRPHVIVIQALAPGRACVPFFSRCAEVGSGREEHRDLSVLRPPGDLA